MRKLVILFLFAPVLFYGQNTFTVYNRVCSYDNNYDISVDMLNGDKPESNGYYLSIYLCDESHAIIGYIGGSNSGYVNISNNTVYVDFNSLSNDFVSDIISGVLYIRLDVLSTSSDYYYMHYDILTESSYDLLLSNSSCQSNDSIYLNSALIFKTQGFNQYTFQNTSIVNNSYLYLNNSPGLYNSAIDLTLENSLYGCVFNFVKDFYINDVPRNTSFIMPLDTFIKGTTSVVNITNSASCSNCNVSYAGSGVYVSGIDYFYNGNLSNTGNDVVSAWLSVTSGSVNNGTYLTCNKILNDTVFVVNNPGVPAPPNIKTNGKITKDTIIYNKNTTPSVNVSEYYGVLCENDSIKIEVESPNALYNYSWSVIENSHLRTLGSGNSIWYKPLKNDSSDIIYIKVRGCNFLNCSNYQNIRLYEYVNPTKPELDSVYCVKDSVLISPITLLNNRYYLFNNTTVGKEYNHYQNGFKNLLFAKTLDSNNVNNVNFDNVPLSRGNDTLIVDRDKRKCTCYSLGVDTAIMFHTPVLNFSTSSASNTLVEGEAVQFINQSLYDFPGVNGQSQYYWNFGDGAISFEKNPWHYYYVGGYHDVYLSVVSDSTGCASDTTYYNYIYVNSTATTSVKELKKKGFEVLQNSNEVWIKNTNNFNPELNVKLYSLTGQEITGATGKETVVISTAGLSSGIYVLNINNEKPLKLFVE